MNCNFGSSNASGVDVAGGHQEAPSIEQDLLVNKTHCVFAAIENATNKKGLFVHEVVDATGMSSKDVSRILSRCAQRGRISRTKDHDEPEAYFRYWLTPAQRKRFHIQAKGYRATISPPSAGTSGDAHVDSIIQRYAKRLRTKEEVSEDLAQWEAKLKAVDAEIWRTRYAIEHAKKRLVKQERELIKLNADVIETNRQLSASGAPLVSAKALANRALDAELVAHSALLGSSEDAARLAQRLHFLRKLRTRPALADLTLLGDIENDYASALSIARGADG